MGVDPAHRPGIPAAVEGLQRRDEVERRGRRRTRDGVSWLTTIGDAPPPAPAGPAFAADFAEGALSADGYRAAVASAVDGIRAGAARKVVLARDIVAGIPADADLRPVIARLAQAYPDTFTFAVDGLIGSSPETLVRERTCRGRQIGRAHV